jgi:hypothetical protein
MKRIRVTALIRDPEVIQVLKESKARNESFELYTVRNGVIMSLIDKDGRYSPQPYAGSFHMEMTEGKSEDGVVTVVCDRNGEKMKPYWIKNKHSQRSVDAETDVRFSVRESACIVTIDEVGRFVVSMARIKDHTDYIEIREVEIFSAVVRRNGGKFLFNENMFSDSDRYQFRNVAKAAIRKANSRDGGGPMFFVEKDPSVAFHEVQTQSTMASTGECKAVFSGGMTMVSNQVL